MKLKFSLIAAMLAVATLSACGGSDDQEPQVLYPVASPATLTKTETTIGTGAEATTGKQVTLHYTGYLYSATAAGNKGPQFETSVGRQPLIFVVGDSRIISGFSEGALGMKVGGKRTVAIPAGMAYGAAGRAPSIPPNAGLVFDLELLAVQ